MFRLDKNFHKVYNLNEPKREIDQYKQLSFEERAQVFAYLQSVAYNYKLGSPPKMDKSVHSSR